MESLVFVLSVTAIAFWFGRKTNHFPTSSNDIFANSAIQSRASWRETDATRIPMNIQRAFALIFISGWIIAWSVGLVIAALMFLSSLGSGPATIFLGGWLIAAIAGWFAAASTIYKLVAGKPIQFGNGQTY